MHSTDHHHHRHHSDHPHTVAHHPIFRQAIKLATAGTLGLVSLTLSGLTMTTTVLGVVVVTPLLVLFSPVLVPATTAVVLGAIGLTFSGGCAAAAVGVASWAYNYVKGRHPIGADALDHARRVAEDAAFEVKEKVLEVKDRVADDVASATADVKEKTREKGRKGQNKAQAET